MDVACCLYDDMTVLDFVGAYDPLTRLVADDSTSVSVDVCARAQQIRADGLTIAVDRVEPDLGGYDLLFVPGGQGSRALRTDDAFLDWLRSAAACEYLTSVCTGSLLLGAAGFLDGRRATTHPSAFDLLGEYAEVVDDRIVRDGRVITGRGVSSSLDLGLYLVELLADRETREAVAIQMDYPYGPADDEWPIPGK